MLKIDRSTLLEPIDFMKNKGHKPFSIWRTVSKIINFMLLFGASAISFSVKLENFGFTESECDDYLKLTNQEKFYQNILANSKGKSKKDCKFLAVATLMRNAFLSGYQGLADRISREQNFAYQHGYVRCYHGPVRHLPELRFMKLDRNKNLIGADKILYSKQFSHLINQACNTTVQTMEARIAFATWHNINYYLKKWNLRSFTTNSVHDSLEISCYKPELQLVIALIAACANWLRPPVEGIKMYMDSEASDLSPIDDKNGKIIGTRRDDTYYKHGVEIKSIPIEDAVRNWNQLHGTEIEWSGCLT